MRRIIGDDADNSFVGTDKDEWYRAFGGNDAASGRGGNDTLDGGTGVDSLFGGAGDDVVRGFKEDSGAQDKDAGDLMDGGAGDDQVVAGQGDTGLGGAGDDLMLAYGGAGGRFEGGAGADRLSFYFTSPDAFVGDTAFLSGRAQATIEGAAVSGFETGKITFGEGDDVVSVTRHPGNWTLDGGNGDDHLIGRGGADTLVGGFGSDTLDGGAGDDVLYDSSDKLAGQTVNVQVMHGGAGNDQLTVLYGAATLSGGKGDDVLFGSGDLAGGAGADTLMAWSGVDVLRGGAGADTYVFERYNEPPGSLDRIVDGTIASVDLSPLDAVLNTFADDAFRIVDAFDGEAGELTIRYSAQDGLTHVEGDASGGGTADLVILISGDHTDPADYVL